MFNPKFILACTGLLGLKVPVSIEMFEYKASAMTNAAAFYESFYRNGKMIKHAVRINIISVIQSEYTVEDMIAHELVHAVMAENGIMNTEYFHCPVFQSLCLQFEKDLKLAGFTVGALYNPLVDTE